MDFSGKTGVFVLTRVSDLDYQREVGSLVHNVSKEDYVWNVVISLGCILVLSPIDKTKCFKTKTNNSITTQ